jgi:subtilisin family serine protease
MSPAAVPNQWIVVLNDSAAGRRGPQSRAAAVAATLVGTHGGRVRGVYRYALNGFALDASPAIARALSEHPSVAWVEPAVSGQVAQPPVNFDWNLDRINQRYLPLDAQELFNRTGLGTNIYIIDTGVRITHQEFGGRAFFGVDTVDDGHNGADCYGHGTQSASVAAGAQLGIAKQATIWNVRVFGCTQQASTTAMAIAGVEWITANHQPRSVANMSLNYYPSDALELAVTTSIASGVTYTLAAGNEDSPASIWSPGRGVANALLVGASFPDDSRANFSNYGPLVDLFAPGFQYVGASPGDDFNVAGYGGTSGAAPHVAGAAALYLEAYPTATPVQVHDALIRRATKDVIINPGLGSHNRLLFAPAPSRVINDFDGDATSDIAVFRPSAGTWHILKSSTGFTASQTSGWGENGDIPVAGDFDGDGRSDLARFRPYCACWVFVNSSTGQGVVYEWGQSGDLPAAEDFDGDRRTDIAVFRPSVGTWYILRSSSNFSTSYSIQWGENGDVPVPRDYDGDGKADVAIYRPNGGYWYIVKSTNNQPLVSQWGQQPGDVPIPADYDGDLKTDIAIYRPSGGGWYILKSTTGPVVYVHGNSTDVPVPRDHDGDGRADLAIFRQPNEWYINLSTGNYLTQTAFPFGLTGDIPVR